MAPLLDGLPKDFTYGVEVRHPESFAKGEAEQQLNRGLHQRNVNRVILDSRPVHSAAATSPAMIDAQQKKPKVPVHAVMTARQPMVRFIGGDVWSIIGNCFASAATDAAEMASVGDAVAVPPYPQHCLRAGAGGVPWLGDLRSPSCQALGNAPSIPQRSFSFLISCYHIRSHLPELKGVFVSSARCMPF